MKRIILQILIAVSIVAAIPYHSSAQSKIQRAPNSKKTTTETVRRSIGDSKKQTYTPSKSSASKKQASKSPANKFTFEIIDVSFANADASGKIIDAYDSKLYAKEIMYLKPRITYKSNNPSLRKITLSIKIIDEADNLKKGTDSPAGFTYSTQLQPLSASSQQYVLIGWGNTIRTHYSPGAYRYEFWLDGEKIYEKSVRLYSGVQPIVDNSFFKINSATVCSTDENNNVEISNPDNFYSKDVKYLTTKLNYTGLSRTEQTIPVYVRFFNSNGYLLGGDKSPDGYTYKTNVTIKPGANTLLFPGWGNTAGGSYGSGDVRIEYWIDGEKIHEGHVIIKADEEKSQTNTNGYEWVDLGLPSGKKWATMNVGATKPYDSGTFYNWGKTYPYRIDDNYHDFQRDISGNSSYDVARSIWGDSWRIPTLSEWKELFAHCKATEIKEHGQECTKLTGKNGAYIIIPRCGWLAHDGDKCNPTIGNYWTSTPGSQYDFNATQIEIFDSGMSSSESYKKYGLLIRPLID